MKKNILFWAVAAALLTSSCSDFLDVQPEGNATTTTYFTTDQQAIDAVDALYERFHQEAIYGRELFWEQGAACDVVWGRTRSYPTLATLKYTGDEDPLRTVFETMYTVMARSNWVIEQLLNKQKSTALTDIESRSLGEAYFTKAYFYFEAVRTWGDLPIYRSTPQIADKTKKRSPKSEVYALIEEDLLFATQNLPRKAQLDAKDLGRATSDVAWALLAKVYLYQEKYAEAKKAIEDNLLPLVPAEYDLMENFEDNFTMANEHCKESIFEINFRHKSDDWGLTTTGNYSAYAQGPRPFMGYGGNQPLQLLADAFEPGDTRKEGTLLTLDELKAWETPEDFASLEFDHTGYYNQKVYIKPEERIGTEDVFSMPNNLRIIRLSEVYLIYAEAVCKLGTDDALAREYMNKVRRRAGLKDNTTATGEALFDAIINENRYEFAMEGHRYFDLVRTGKAEEVFSSPEFKAVKPNAVYRPGYSELFPIPQSEIDNSQGNIVQNPM